uniref:Nuclease associated modular domain-containing protein n=1 Tax=viral metagenome TaxID=1070528 RepID=A0A6M3L028_9ZZZZ
MTRLCKCGCGLEVKPKREFLRGHYARVNNPMKGKNHSLITKMKISKKVKGRKRSPESIAKIAKARRGRKHSLETKIKMSRNNGMHRSEVREKVRLALNRPDVKIKMSLASSGRFVSIETRNKISRIHKGKKKPYMSIRMLGENNPMKNPEIAKKSGLAKKGRIQTLEERFNRGKSFRGKHLSATHREKISKAIKNLGNRHPMRIPRIKAIQMKKWARTSGLKEPNKPERELDRILQSLFPKEYKLNTKKRILILGGKIPDFVNINGKKKLIELYGDYWHRGQDPNKRINYFKQFGWNTMVIWEKELKEESKLKIRLTNFHERGIDSRLNLCKIRS